MVLGGIVVFRRGMRRKAKLHDAGQGLLFPVMDIMPRSREETSSSFVDNMRLPVHRWIRFSAGFSAIWAESVIADFKRVRGAYVLDPFAGSGTTLLAAENVGVNSIGIEAHPFVCRITRAKLARRSDPQAYSDFIHRVRQDARQRTPDITHYPPLIRKCFDDDNLKVLDTLRQAVDHMRDDSPAWDLSWLTLVSILRKVSHAGTAQWQYVLPKKSKKHPMNAMEAFDATADLFHGDMLLYADQDTPPACFLQSDARTCEGVDDNCASLVLTSPPYPNNYDYADATRLEMCFMGEIQGWGDLQGAVRRHLVRSCAQHVPEKAVDIEEVLARSELAPIRGELSSVCAQLAEVRLTKGGRKTYHLMVACYFLDLARVWVALRRVCRSPSTVCFVIGDSAPYGVYVPVIEWLGGLALAAGFKSFRFERTRDRNVKWKNRKHRVPLREGRLWVEG